MARVRGTPSRRRLPPTRRAAYVALANADELSTVQPAAVEVDRYNLYHHLKKLASLELIENHRDEGRARWWRVRQHVNLPELLNASEPTPPVHRSHPLGRLADQGVTLASLAVDEDGREVIVLNLEGSRPSQRKTTHRPSFRRVGLSLDVPWNFIPEQLVLYSKKK